MSVVTSVMTVQRDEFIEQFKMAAAEGAVFELKLRLLADKFQELQKDAHSRGLPSVVTKVAIYFGRYLPEADKKKLENCCELRNKILHIDFRAAREVLGKLGLTTEQGRVKKIHMIEPTIASVAEQIDKANLPGAFVNVAETQTTEYGNIYG